MTAHDDFDGMLSDWLDDQAGRGAPDYVDEILVRTTRTRQRPAWSSLERWLPLQLAFTSRLAPFGRLAWSLLAIALIVLAAAVLLLAGVGQRRLPHFGSAANGAIAFVDGGNLRVAAADGTNPRTLMSLPSGAEQLTFSPDGTRMAYRTTGLVPSIVVANPDGSGPVAVVSSAALGTGEPFAWSPDSRRLVFTMLLVPDKIGTTDVVDADGSHLKQLIQGSAAESVDRFAPSWSPNGEWISFFSSEANGYVALNVIHPDGTGERRLATSPMNPHIIDMSWSPDPAESRVVYVSGGYVDMFDLATAKETTIGTGFWPTWSPDGARIAWWTDGTKVVAVTDLLAETPRPISVFPSLTGNCQDHPEGAGKVMCAPAEWSPDGLWVYGPDVTGSSIVLARSDGSRVVRTIKLEHPLDLQNGPAAVVAWQPIAP